MYSEPGTVAAETQAATDTTADGTTTEGTADTSDYKAAEENEIFMKMGSGERNLNIERSKSLYNGFGRRLHPF